MKTLLKSTLAVLFMFGLSFNSYAVMSTPGDVVVNTKAKKESAFTQLTVEEIFTMPKDDIEAKIGRKLKFKEKLGLRIVQKAAKRMEKRMEKRNKKKGTEVTANENLFGIIAISAGGAGLLSSFTGYGGLLLGAAGITLGIISRKRDEPKKILGILGIVFGAIAVLLSILLLLILVLSVFA